MTKRQLSISIDTDLYNKLKNMSNNPEIETLQYAISSILELSLDDENSSNIKVSAETDKKTELTIKEWIEKGRKEVNPEIFKNRTPPKKTISKNFKESIYSLSLSEKEELERLLENIFKYIEQKGYKAEIGSNINASIHAYRDGRDSTSHVIYLQIENKKLTIGRLMHFNRKSAQLKNDFIWKKIMECISLYSDKFIPSNEKDGYVLNAETMKLLADHFYSELE